jgi:erythromycin esterase-like protein
VWTDWLGMIDREPEISWEQMPTEENGGAESPETQWQGAQVAILRRAAAGEYTFRPDANDPAARREFDETVEHVLALQRRGLLTCATPIAELRADAQYAAIGDVVLTDDGRRALERADAPERGANAP